MMNLLTLDLLNKLIQDKTIRCFVCTTWNHYKYYCISEETGEARYGRIWAAYQTAYYSKHEVSKKIREKLGKGYVEVDKESYGLTKVVG